MKKTKSTVFLKGISLIVLVITILVMVVLAATAIITLSNSGILNKSNEASFKAAMKAYIEELNVYVANNAVLNGDIDEAGVNVALVTSGENTDLKNIIKGVKKEHSKYLSIEKSKLVFNMPESSGETDKNYGYWACELGIEVKGFTSCADIKKADRKAYLTGKFVNGVSQPDLTGFNVAKTRYVYFETSGEMTIGDTIDNEPRSNWYDYTNKKWANIIVFDENNISMFVWIPRYEYKVESGTTTVNYISRNTVTATTGYKIPESFTWDMTDSGGSKVNLAGFWTSKYKLSSRDTTNTNMNFNVNKNSIKATVETTSTGSLKYMYYISELGETPIKRESSTSNIYTYTGLKAGKTYEIIVIVYTLNGENLSGVAGISRKVVVVGEPEAPELTGFNNSITQYITYDSNGKIAFNGKISSNAPASWYDYQNMKWANIKVLNKNNITSLVWIPRYEYNTYSYNGSSRTDINYISQDKVIATDGYKIPESFTWDMTDSGGSKVNLAGFWTSKYKISGKDTQTADFIYKTYSNYIDVTVDPKTVDSGTVAYEYFIAKKGENFVKKGSNSTGIYTFSNLDSNSTYSIYVIIYKLDGSSNVVSVLGEVYKDIYVYVPGTPDLTGFNSSNTKYLTFDGEGNAIEGNLISGQAPASWFNYQEMLWANIRISANSGTADFVWIPRYEYRYYSYNGTDKTDVNFIPATKTTPTIGYKIPESFTWDMTDSGGSKVNLTGFWTSKYKLSQK